MSAIDNRLLAIGGTWLIAIIVLIVISAVSLVLTRTMIRRDDPLAGGPLPVNTVGILGATWAVDLGMSMYAAWAVCIRSSTGWAGFLMAMGLYILGMIFLFRKIISLPQQE